MVSDEGNNGVIKWEATLDRIVRDGFYEMTLELKSK